MSFTDDDLKRLKVRPGAWCHCNMAHTHFDPVLLLARLEAAEEHIKFSTPIHIQGCSPIDGDVVCDCGSKKAENAWRKAAGRDKKDGGGR